AGLQRAGARPSLHRFDPDGRQIPAHARSGSNLRDEPFRRGNPQVVRSAISRRRGRLLASALVLTMRTSHLLVLCAVLALNLSLGVVEAAGPWKAQLVDAKTKQPLEGVVVLAWWTRNVRTFGGPSEEYCDSQEALTDMDGRFTIAPRRFWSLNPLVFFRGPFVAMFKSGYGGFRWPGYEGSEAWPKEKRESLQSAAHRLQRDGIVLEMSRLRTAEQRNEYMKALDVPAVAVPLDKQPLMREAIADEQRSLGNR